MTDKYLNGIPESSRAANTQGLIREGELNESIIDCLRKLNIVAKERGQSLAQMALSWVLRDGRVTSALIGASSPKQIIENCKSVHACEFSTEEIEKIDSLLSKINLPPSLWAGEA